MDREHGVARSHRLAVGDDSPALHRGRRGARPAGREEGKYREYVTPLEQRPARPERNASAAECSGTFTAGCQGFSCP